MWKSVRASDIAVCVRVVFSGEVFSLQSRECAGGVLHAVCSAPYRLYEEEPAHCQVRQHAPNTQSKVITIMILCICLTEALINSNTL